MAVTTITTKSENSRKPRSIAMTLRYALLYSVLIVLALIFLFPFYSMTVGSLMPKEELFRSYPQMWPPTGPQLTAYRLLLQLASPEAFVATVSAMSRLEFGRDLPRAVLSERVLLSKARLERPKGWKVKKSL